MKRILYILPITCLLFLSGTISIAQHKSIKYQLANDRKRADRLFSEKAYPEAVDLYKEIVQKDSSDASVKLRLAESFWMLNNTLESEYWFSKSVVNESGLPSIDKLYYAEALLSNGKKEEAFKWFDLYSKENNQESVSANKKKGIMSYDQYYLDSLAYTIREVSVNSNGSDFCPVYFQKGILFLSSREDVGLVKYVNASEKADFLNLYFAEFSNDTGFTTPVKFSDFDNSLHEGPVTFFSNNTKAIFSSNGKNKKKGITRLSLYYAEKSSSDKWSIKALPFNSHSYSLSHPWFDENTSTLYFASNMPEGYGGTDIYSVIFKDGKWETPKNLGAEINTSGNEMFPFVSKDSCLYFTSNGHPGMGGLDIFKTDLKHSPSYIENLGYPVNTFKDDFSLIIDKSGTQGFFSSNRKNSYASDNIYAVNFHSIRFEGQVVERIKAIPQENALVKLVDSKSGRIINTLRTNQKGEFGFFISPGRKYEVEVSKESYKSKKTEILSLNAEEKTIRKTVVLEQSNKSFVNGKVLYDTTFLANCKVAIITFNADSVETMYSDQNGQFQCEINTDTTNIFYIEKDTLKGVFKLEPSKRKRKGSGMSYIMIVLGDIVIRDLEALYMDSTGAPMANQTLYLRNELDKEEIAVETDKDGKFTMKLWLYGKYTLFRKENDVYIPLKTFIPDKINILEIKK